MLNLLIILIVLLNAIVLVRSLLAPRRNPRWIDFLPSGALGLCVLEFFLDEFWFRMVPLYALTIVIFLVTLRRLWQPSNEPSKKRWPAIVLSVAGLLVLAQSAAYPLWILPFHPFPEPTGPYRVGTVTYAWEDTTRPETYSDDPNDHRELPVQVWYPVDPADEIGGDNIQAPLSAAEPSRRAPRSRANE